MKLNKMYQVVVILFMICNVAQASNRANLPPHVQDELDELHDTLGIINPRNDKLLIAIKRRDDTNFDVHALYGTYQLNPEQNKIRLHPNDRIKNNEVAQKILTYIGHHMALGYQQGIYTYPSDLTDLPIGGSKLLE